MKSGMLLLLLLVKAGGAVPPATPCLPDQQRDIANRSLGCTARPALVEVRPLLPVELQLQGALLAVLPEQVRVERCGGGCPGPAPHACRARLTAPLVLEVLVVLAGWEDGEQRTVCTQVPPACTSLTG